MTEVQLAIYDLSRGMARGLSAQFLGPAHAIEIIPHTAIIVFGREYFFGGGIQSADPHAFRNSQQMFPIEVQSLGVTNASKQEFEQWCRTMGMAEYRPEAYDLFSKNCNNFSHDAALQGLRLSRGVPEWILQVPQRFLSSPMGQMMRPMLEQMQVTGGGGSAPFANASAATSAPFATSSAAPTPPADHNPWANMTSTTSDSSPAVSKKSAIPSTPTLDAHKRPLLSNDTNVVGVCASKLSKAIENEGDQEVLQELSKQLSSGTIPSNDAIENSSRILLDILNGGNSSNTVFALMLFRLVVLHPPPADNEGRFAQVIAWVAEKLKTEKSLLSAPARSMAWCTLSNAYRAQSSLITNVDTMVETALGDLSPEAQPRPEVRQSAAAFLYNVAHQQCLVDTRDEVPDLLVSLLCGSMDGLVDESDGTTCFRRLLVAGRIIKPDSEVVNNAAKNLVVDLGFTSAIAAVSTKHLKGGDADKCKTLARELQSLVEMY